MVPVLILTHGSLADELLRAATTIDPHLQGAATALSLPWDVDFDQATRLLRQALRDADRGDGVLVVTDMFGGTATNVVLPFLAPDKVEVVTGVNLPMLVKLASVLAQGLTLRELALRLTEAGQRSIRVASDFLVRPRTP